MALLMHGICYLRLPTSEQLWIPPAVSCAGGDWPELLALSTHSLYLTVILGLLLSPIRETPLIQPFGIFTCLGKVCLLAYLTVTSRGPVLGLMLPDT